MQVAEATLIVLAEQILQKEVPHSIRCDIRQLVRADADQSELSLHDLFEGREASSERGLLRDEQLFRSIAEPLAENFIALSMLRIGWHERRIVHYSYDESLWLNRTPRFGTFIAPAVGRARNTYVTVPSVGDSDSYHFEIEAPDGLQIGTREWFRAYPADKRPVERIRKAGSYQRSHIHFRQVEPGAEALVIARLYPRSSAIVRSGCFASGLAFIILLFIQLRLTAIAQPDNNEMPAAATVLLGFQGIVSLYLARSDQNAMTTNLLWPVRIVAVLPGVAAFLAAAAVVGGSTGTPTRIFLWAMVAVSGFSALALGVGWARFVLRARDTASNFSISVRSG